MELSQAINNPGIGTDYGAGATFLGLSGSQVFWAVVVLAVLLLAFWWLSGYRSDNYVGQKGGRVKKTVEYDDDEIIDEDDL